MQFLFPLASPTPPNHSQTNPRTVILFDPEWPKKSYSRVSRKIDISENFKLGKVNSNNATYPKPYYGKKHSQSINKNSRVWRPELE